MRTKKIDPEIAIAVQCQYTCTTEMNRRNGWRAVLVDRAEKAVSKLPNEVDTSKGPWKSFGKSETMGGIKCN